MGIPAGHEERPAGGSGGRGSDSVPCTSSQISGVLPCECQEGPLSAQELNGRVAVITGASKGLGKQMAESLAAAGAAVALVARNRELLEAVKAGIGDRAEAFAGDVTNENDVASIAAQIRARLGPPDILINNAGINIRKPIHEF